MITEADEKDEINTPFLPERKNGLKMPTQTEDIEPVEIMQ